MRYKAVNSKNVETLTIAGGELTKILATGIDTDNKVSIFDSYLPKGHGAPIHYHEIDDEIFYIISGQLTFTINGETVIANPGDLMIAGPMVPRGFVANEDSHILGINAVSGPSEGFMRDIATFKEGQLPTQEDKERFAKEYKIHLVEN